MKNHGLWVYYRAFKAARSSSEGLEWWHGEEAESTLLKRYLAVHLWNTQRAYPSLAERVIRCTNRYARIFGGIRTVADWRKLALHIAERAGFTHPSTIRALQFENYRDASVIRVDCRPGNDCSLPKPKWPAVEVRVRAEKIKAARQERLRQERNHFLCSCAICGSEATHPQWVSRGFFWPLDGKRILEITGLLSLAELYDWQLEQIPFCFSHGMQFRRILKRTERLQQQRIQINRIKKELRSEASQNYA